MKNLILFLSALLLVFSSCEKEDSEPKGCLEEATDFTSGGCGGIQTPNTVCDVIEVGSYTLDDFSRSFQPYFCDTETASHVYVNKDGNERTFTVEQRTFFKSTAIFASNTSCTSDPDKNIGYCITFEEINYRIKDQLNDLELTITVYTKPDLDNQDGDNAGDYVEILRVVDNSFLQLDFSIVVQQKSLTTDATPRQEFYENIDLNTIPLTDVYSNDVSGLGNATYKYYYTKDRGLVGFVDSQSTVWVLKS